MNRGIWIAVALLAAAPAHGQDEAKKDAPATKAAPTAKHKGKKAKDEKGAKTPQAGGSSAWGTGGPAKGSVASKQTSAPAAAHAADRTSMLRARAVYRYAVESCAQSGKSCDTSLRDDAEVKFIDSCLPCAPRERCEAERDTIRAGNSKTTTALCGE